MLIIFAAMASVVGVWKFYPEQVNNAGYIVMGGIAALVGFSIFVPSYIGRGYPHIFHVFLTFPNRIVQYRSMFVEYDETEPLGKVLDIVPLMEKDDRGYDIPKWWGNRWFYPYLVKTMNQIDTPRYGGCEFHVFVLTQPWQKYFQFLEMPLGAELYGELFTHPSTALFVSMMAPFSIKHLGLEIPVYLGVFSDYGAARITEDWVPTMREAARYTGKFDQIMEDYKQYIYPFKEIELLGDHILTPEAKEKLLDLTGKKKKILVAPTVK